MRTMRRDAVPGAQPAKRRLGAWRDRRAPVPSAFPSGAGPDGKTEAGFKPGSGGRVRTGRSETVAVLGPTRSPGPQPRSPRALETTGIHLNFALGLSNEVGPPQGGPAPGRPGLRHAHSAGLDSRQEEALSHSMGIGTAPEHWGSSEKRRRGVRESRHSSTFFPISGYGPAASRPTAKAQIVQSCTS